ncbi:MAG: signal peptidase II [Candidatus Polarisedimenticolaceae bacterium]|nr:signal peptidase II [Candidatus Polarisedimenticolaceae bacterium]
MLRWLALSLLVIVADQISKKFAVDIIPLHHSIEVLPFFNWTLMYNEGAAFSFLSDQGGWQRWFFIILSSIITIVLTIWMVRLQRDERSIAISLSLIIGGAIGNLIDRIQLGHVVDFIHLHYQQHFWPAFNVADSAITVGVTIMIVDSLFFAQKREDQRDD